MPKRRTPTTQFALGMDGGVLMNAAPDLDSALVLRLARALAIHPDQVFIGTRLPPAQLATALARLDDAAAEAAARIHGSAAAKSSSSGKSHVVRKKM